MSDILGLGVPCASWGKPTARQSAIGQDENDLARTIEESALRVRDDERAMVQLVPHGQDENDLARTIEESALRVLDDERAMVQLVPPRQARSSGRDEISPHGVGSRDGGGRPSLTSVGSGTDRREAQGSSPAHGPQPWSVAAWPLVHEGRLMGVLEAHAPSDVLRSRQKALQALVDVSGALLTTATRAAEAERSVRETEELLSAAGEGAERKSQWLEIALGTAAHELRGPLAVSRSLLDNLLERDFASAEAWFDLLRRSRHELTHLLSICDTFLRWGMAMDPPEATPTPVGRILDEIVDEASHSGNARGRIRVSCPSNLSALADEHLLRVAVSNLVRNALEHSPEGGLVDLTAQRRGDRIAIGVTDRGPGVAPGDREVIFEPFVKGTASRTARAPGAGLGLFIARRLIEAQNGSIELLVTDEGTTFRVQIPDASQEPAAGRSLQSAVASR